MPLNSKEVNYRLGSVDTIRHMENIPAMEPFAQRVIDFLNALSRKLIRNNGGYSDVATFGFWCRKASVEKMKQAEGDLSGRLGKGIVFHSTPSNVPVNFAFSFAAGLLAGNANIVRLPAKEFPQVDLICDAVNQLLEEEYEDLSPYLCFIKYPPIKAISDYLSLLCNVRVIWGGDATVREMRESPLRPRATEVNFADRHSIALINADAYLELSDQEKAKAALDFYNDTYFSDQNACTAPRLVVWLGKGKTAAKQQFWNKVLEKVAKEYTYQPVQAVGKLTAFCRVAAAKEGLRLEEKQNNSLWRIQLDTLEEDTMNYKYNSGFFFEYDAESIQEIAAVCDERCQTVSYLGFDKDQVCEEILRMAPRGVDRIVPMGKTMDFTLVWDGFDLIVSLSRKINVI